MKQNMVREAGLEPARPKALDPKSSASATSATLALEVKWLSEGIYTALRR